jgi:uncharacterized lipoprotein YmbA
MTIRQANAAALISLALAACGSTAPTRYYTFQATPPKAQPVAGGDLVLRPPQVRWPAAFDRLEVARPDGGVGVTVEGLSRWSAAPEQLADAALTADLLARLPGATLTPWDDAAAPDAVSVKVEVLTLEAGPEGYDLAAVVTITRGAEAPRRRTFRGKAEGAPTPEGEAQAISRLLGVIADDIAFELGALQRADTG